jgi:microcystin-dependent protein
MMDIFPQYMVIAWGKSITLTKTTEIINTFSRNVYRGAPKGWAVCDGGTYMLTLDGAYYEVPLNFPDAITTPDLRGRFILGANPPIETKVTNAAGVTTTATGVTTTASDNRKNLSPNAFNSGNNIIGGNSTHTLLLPQMPEHDHYMFAKETHENYGLRFSAMSDETDTNLHKYSVATAFNAGVEDPVSTYGYSMVPSIRNVAPNRGKTGKEGKAMPFNIIPPYYTLVYIMKL